MTAEELLRGFGAPEAGLPALTEYLANPYADALERASDRLPLDDEPHVAAWRDYAAEAEAEGMAAVLRRRIVQLRFPVREGMSSDPDYRAATRRGAAPDPLAEGAELVDPEGLQLELHESIAGTVPVLLARRRRDFVTLVRCLAGRNEPVPVPDAMGACLVKGLVNWDRIGRLRRLWEESSRGGSWSDELRRLMPQKELYQDRFLLLSRGPYSGVAAAGAGLDEGRWLEDSVRIRRDHECFHYLTLRLFGSIRSHLLDELLADAAGLVGAYGRYDGALALRFLGLEDHPRVRPGGRLDVYTGTPEHSPTALAVVRRLAVEVVETLEGALDAERERLAAPGERALVLLALAARGLDGLAAAAPVPGPGT